MVRTTVRRPRSAARRASDAAVVVLPTPPEPVQTRILARVEDRVDVQDGRDDGGAGAHAIALRLEQPGQLVEAGQVDGCRRAAAARRTAGRAPRARRGRAPRAPCASRGRSPRRAGTSTSASGASSPAFSSPATTAAAVERALLGVAQGHRRQQRRPHGVDDHRADGQADLLELGGAVDRLLHGHLLQQGHEVDRGLRRPEDGHDAVGLGLERTDLGQAADLGADVEEPRDAAGGRRVEHDRVVDVRVGPGRARARSCRPPCGRPPP